MKVTLERNHLLKSLGHVHRVVERRNTYPILANVLLKASDGKLDLRATDLDIEVTESVPAMVGQAGTTTVPAHTLYEIVRKLADGAEVRLENEGSEQLLVSSGRSRFHLACLSPDSFPDLKSGTFTHTFTIGAQVFRVHARRLDDRRVQRGGRQIRAGDQGGRSAVGCRLGGI